MLEQFVAGGMLLAASTVAALDTAPARAVRYAVVQWRRRRRQIRSTASESGQACPNLDLRCERPVHRTHVGDFS
jgi:hypothetical protein